MNTSRLYCRISIGNRLLVASRSKTVAKGLELRPVFGEELPPTMQRSLMASLLKKTEQWALFQDIGKLPGL